MEHKQARKLERVLLETSRYRVKGTIMLPPEGYKSRLSDHLNESGREFLVILDATLTPFDDPEAAFEAQVIMVQRAKVDIIFPMGEPAGA
jgi:hypothetical protein